VTIDADFEAKLIKVLSEPFEAIRHFFDYSKLPSNRFVAANKSLIADLLGDDPVAVPPSQLDRPVLDLMYAILSLSGPAGRFSVYKKMFQSYPWRNRISRADHLQSAYYLFAHECYILEARLKIFFQAIDSYAKFRRIEFDTKRIAKRTLKVHRDTFDIALRWRGRHVHEDDFVPRDIKRIGLLDSMIIGEKLGHSKTAGAWLVLQKLAMKDAKKQWMVHCEEAQKAAYQIVMLAFDGTRLVWQRLADERERY